MLTHAIVASLKEKEEQHCLAEQGIAAKSKGLPSPCGLLNRIRLEIVQRGAATMIHGMADLSPTRWQRSCHLIPTNPARWRLQGNVVTYYVYITG